MNYETFYASDNSYQSPNFIDGIYYEDERLGYDADIEYYDDGDEEFRRKRTYETRER